MRKLAGLVSYGNLTLQKGVTEGSLEELFTWRGQVEAGRLQEARRSVTVTLLDEESNPAARWEFVNAWPTQYDAPDLDASANEVAIESLEIVHEGMTRKEP
jgi:phage tail-like protein